VPNSPLKGLCVGPSYSRSLIRALAFRDIVLGTVRLYLRVYPLAIADLSAALGRVVRSPFRVPSLRSAGYYVRFTLNRSDQAV